MILGKGLLALSETEHGLLESLDGGLPGVMFRHSRRDRAGRTKDDREKELHYKATLK